MVFTGDEFADGGAVISKTLRRNKAPASFFLLIHIGIDPRRMDKFYNRLDELLKELKIELTHLLA